MEMSSLGEYPFSALNYQIEKKNELNSSDPMILQLQDSVEDLTKSKDQMEATLKMFVFLTHA